MKKRKLVRDPHIEPETAENKEKDTVESVPSDEGVSDEISSDEDVSLKTDDLDAENGKKNSFEASVQPDENEKSEYITFRNVKKYYKMGEVTIKAADGIDFEIKKGEFAIIIGASGAGKTTVLNMLGGIDTSDEGDIIVDGAKVSEMSEKDLILYRRHDIGFVFQFYNLVPNLTARENVELAAQISNDPQNIFDVMDSVGLSERMDNFPSQLSGGEQQRVAIARALVKNPKLLLCDEPTGALDYVTGKMILSQLKKTCREENMTVVLITHNAALTPIADRVISMKSGRVISNKINRDPLDVESIEW